jgi:leucyl aminopeptidase
MQIFFQNPLINMIFIFNCIEGKYHAGLMTNDEQWENSCREMSKLSGDLCFPLVFAPELHFKQFDSEVADMTNSVSVRYYVVFESM